MSTLARHYTARRPLHRVNWLVGGNRRQLNLKMAKIWMPWEKMARQKRIGRIMKLLRSTNCPCSFFVAESNWKEIP